MRSDPEGVEESALVFDPFRVNGDGGFITGGVATGY